MLCRQCKWHLIWYTIVLNMQLQVQHKCCKIQTHSVWLSYRKSSSILQNFGPYNLLKNSLHDVGDIDRNMFARTNTSTLLAYICSLDVKLVVLE